MLSLPRAQVPSLVGELRSCRAGSMAKHFFLIKKRKNWEEWESMNKNRVLTQGVWEMGSESS